MGDIARGPRARQIRFVLGCWLLGAAVVLDDEPGWIRIDLADHGVGLPAGQEEQRSH